MIDTTSDEPVIYTRVAHAGESDTRYYAHSVMTDLAGRTTFVGLSALAVSGRLLPAEEIAVLDDIATVITTPDPRIWPLKVARLVSSYGRVVPAIAAGQVWQQSAQMPFWECGAGAEMLLEIDAAIHGDSSCDDHVLAALQTSLRRYEYPVGFGVSFRSWDVRLTTLSRCLHDRGRRDQRRYWRLMERVGEIARTLNLLPSISLGVSAACLDLGFKPQEVAPLASTLVYNCLVANAVEGASQKSALLRKLPQDRVRYMGKPARLSPRAALAESKHE